jgi:hypothetical protein
MHDQAGRPQTMGDLTSKKGWVRIKYDQNVWIPLLPAFPEGDDLPSYCAAVAEEWWHACGLSYSAVDVLRLRHMLIAAWEGTYGHIPCHLMFVHLPDPRQLPLFLYVGVWEAAGNRDTQLRNWCLASDPDAVELPVIDEITTDRLGTGIRVMRYRRNNDGALCAALRYAWRSAEFGTDLVLNATAEDLGRLQRAIPDIDDFANATSIIARAELPN